MEPIFEAESSASAATNEGEERDLKAALRATRSRDTGELVVYVAVISPTLRRDGLIVEDVTADFEYLDGDVLVLRFEFAGESEKPWTRTSCSHVVADGEAFEYVALMYGSKASPLKLAAVKLIEDV